MYLKTAGLYKTNLIYYSYMICNLIHFLHLIDYLVLNLHISLSLNELVYIGSFNNCLPPLFTYNAVKYGINIEILKMSSQT